MDARLDQLEARVGRLENEVAAMRAPGTAGSIVPPAPHTAPPGVISPPGAPPPAVAPPTSPAPRPPDTEREAVLAGTWLARIGIAAVLLGAAFAFKYAVDRGLIGPTGRVLLGLVAGLAFVAWGERARSRNWPRLAQAVAGGGVGLVYLSVWAAFGLYDLIPPVAAFTLLAVVVAGGVALALHHRSEVLAVVALLGAFLNPYLTGIERLPAALFGYVLLVDLGASALSVGKGWRLVEAKAVAATWLVAMIATEGVSPPLVQGFAAVAFLLFVAVVLARCSRTVRVEATDLVVLCGNAVAFFGVSMVVLGDVAGEPRGEFAMLLAGAHLGTGLLLRRFDRPRPLSATFLALGTAFATVAVPIQLDGFAVPIAWTIEAVLLVAVGRVRDLRAARWVGLGVLGLSLLDAVVIRTQLGFSYRPPQLALSLESLTLLVQIAALYVVAGLLRPAGRGSAAEAWSWVAWVGGHLLAVAWLSLETRAAVIRSDIPDPHRVVQFSFTAIWSLYAGALLAAGIATRRRSQRLLAIAIFAMTLAKMVVVDIWLLEPLHRTIVFTGLGLLLLVGSLLYHRFRDLILEGR